MKTATLCCVTLTALFAFAAPSLAQNAIIAGEFQPHPITTGLIGLTQNQTARFGVLNLNAVGLTTANCTVQLQFFDAQNNPIKTGVTPNFAPQAATTLDLTRAEVTGQTTNRVEIRAQVTVNPTPTPNGAPANPGYCTVFPTLQIIDNTTGSTVVFTSDTRAVLTPTGIVPFTSIR
jgi:hypothetical protein